MSPVGFFGLLLLLTFGVLLYFLKPSEVETSVKRQLASIARGSQARTSGVTILRPTKLGTSPRIDALVRQIPGSSRLASLIKQAGKDWQASSVILVCLLSAVVAWWLASVFTPITMVSAAIGIATGVGPILYIYVLREARFRRCDALLPESVDLISRALRAGNALSSALEMVGQEMAEPVGSEFRILHEEQRLGLPLRDAIMNLVERLPVDDVRFLATAMLVQIETGGNLTQILDKTATVMRERVRLRGQLRIYTAQGRITGWILCAMPFILFALIGIVNPGYEKILVTDPFGVQMIHVGLVMMVLGILAIRRIIDVKA